MNPNSIYIKEREKIEDNNISRDIVDLIKWVKEIQTEIKKYKKMQGSLSIKFYNSLPLDFYCRTDNSIYVRPYVHDKVGRERIMYQFQVGSKGGEYYEEIFETLWLERSNIKTSDSYNNYFYINQKKVLRLLWNTFLMILEKI